MCFTLNLIYFVSFLHLTENIMENTCTFNSPQLCNYTISCKDEREYIWMRHSGATPTFGTGPDMDISETKHGKLSMQSVRSDKLLFVLNKY